MSPVFIDDYFVSNLFFPFLFICLILGIVSFFLTIVRYFVSKADEIKEKESAINDAFLNVKKLCKKRILLLEKIVNEIWQFKDLIGEYEREVLQKFYDEKFRNQKRLEKIHDFGKVKNSIRNIIELENMIDYTLRQILAIGTKYPDVKTYSKYLNHYAEYKALDGKIDSGKSFYNRKVKEFNHFIVNAPYIFLAFIFKINPRQIF